LCRREDRPCTAAGKSPATDRPIAELALKTGS
jgi:hypothetical protein